MFGSYRQRKGSRVPQVPSMPLSKLVKADYCFHMFVSVYLGNFQYDSSWDLSPECGRWGVWGEQEGMRTSGHPSLQQDLATGWASRKPSTSSWLAVHSSFSDSFYVCLSHWCSIFSLNMWVYWGNFLSPTLEGQLLKAGAVLFTSQYPQHRGHILHILNPQ